MFRPFRSTTQPFGAGVDSARHAVHRLSGIVYGALLVTIVLGPGAAFAGGATGLWATVSGTLNLVWGDGGPGTADTAGPVAVLTDVSGKRIELLLADETVRPFGGLLDLDGKRITVEGSWMQRTGTTGAPTVLDVDSVRLAPGEAPSAVSSLNGSQPWVSVLCKFSDISSEPRTLAYFQNMFTSSYPGLDHYWRELSYDNINVVGSGARGWYVLPNPRSYYVDASGNVDLNLLFNDCTAAADADVYYPNFVGINLMFNDTIGSYAWGGNHWATLDGVSRSWRTTWEPPWGYENITVMSHEMGHGFGLPHSTFGNDGNPYDNAWDVMSDTWSYTISDPTYGHVGQHTITYHKDQRLGWLRPPERVTVGTDDSTTVNLERLAQPQSPGPKEVYIPIGGSSSHFYTVESRRRVGYDVSLPGEGVIIHEVDTTRTEPAHVQGSDGATGAIFSAGDVFRDATNNIGIAVVSSLDTGYQVSVSSGSAMAASFPTIDETSGTGTSSNLNGVLEPGETVLFAPSWTNASASTLDPAGSLSGFTGPAGATYGITDATAAYGSVATAATASCTATGNCYQLTLSNPATRPTQHWDTSVTETLSSGATKAWTIHVGSSFPDVPPGRWAYRFIETLYHSGITAGCGGGNYCPGQTITRWEMAVFLAAALTDGQVPVSGTVEGLGAYNCVAGGTSLFSDVPPGDVGCKHIHYIAARKITAGCGGGRFCPGDLLNRWQMGVFLATAMAGANVPSSGTVPGMGSYNCVAGGSSVFGDVPPTDAGCRFIHFLAAKGVTAGCGNGDYCPSDNLARDQMAVFMTAAFELKLTAP